MSLVPFFFALTLAPQATIQTKIKIPYGSVESALPKLPSTPFGRAVASDLAAIEKASIQHFVKAVKESGKLDRDYAYSYTSEPSSVYTSPSLISICMGRYSYLGGAHGMTWSKTYNYRWDGKKANHVKLKDFFAPGTDLNAVVRYPLVQKMLANPNTDWLNDGTAQADELDLETFTVSPKGLRFYYDPYVLGPYAVGAFEFELSTKELGPSFRLK